MCVIGVQPGTPKAKYLRMIARGGLWLSGFLNKNKNKNF